MTERWADFIVIRRDRLNSLLLEKDIGSEYTDKKTGKEHLKLTFSFTKDDVVCSGESFQAYRIAWTILPPLRPTVIQETVIAADEPGCPAELAEQPAAPAPELPAPPQA